MPTARAALLLFLTGAITAPLAALAAPPPEDDFGWDEEDEEDDDAKPSPAPVDEGPDPAESDDVDPDASGRTGIDLFSGDPDEQEDGRIDADGSDSARTFRAAEERIERLPTDEQILAWEAYLKKYPATGYGKEIGDKIEDLQNRQYEEKIVTRQDVEDAGRQELIFAQPIGMPNVNPRTRAQVGITFGFPSYIAADLDFEYAFLRSVSAHIGVQGRYTGWNLETGARWAFVKSSRQQLVATLVADFGMQLGQRIEADATNDSVVGNSLQFVGRPQIAVGKIIGPVQVLVSAGTELLSRAQSTPAILGGVHVSGRVAPPLAVFGELSVYARELDRQGGAFVFNTLNVGLRFYPMSARKPSDPLEVSMSGDLPVTKAYYEPFLGGVTAQATYHPSLPWLKN